MTGHRIGTREEWLAERLELLGKVRQSFDWASTA